MDSRVDEGLDRDIAWLPGERFEMALDAQRGAVSAPQGGADLLTVTSHRAVRTSGQAGRRTTSIVPLSGVTAIDVVDVSRPSERLSQGLLVLAVGIVLGWVSWAVINVALVSLLVGGLPVLAAVYMLAGYLFPDAQGELVLHAGAYSLHQPLTSNDSRRDAYLVAHRIYELMAGDDARRGPLAPEPAPQPEEVAALAPFPPYGLEPGAGSGAPSVEGAPPAPAEAAAEPPPEAAEESIRAHFTTGAPPSNA